MKKIILPLFIILVSAFQSVGQGSDPYMGIIPAPENVTKVAGEFKITPETIILVDSPENKAIKYLAAELKRLGYSYTITDINGIDKKHRNFKNMITLSHIFKEEVPFEGYYLVVAPDNIVLKGRTAGMFYGVQTLLQLIHKTSPGYATVPCVEIKDHPRFSYRGMHLDVARHFFDVDFVKRYLDLMASYKLNNFHWHLTDDQGWRIEVKKYPKLTAIGSKRAQTKVGNFKGNDSDLYDNTPYEGFYTQEQVKEIVDYASDRYINIIPEIEMPGHCMAAITAYPELSCDAAKPYKVSETWGTTTDVFCPTDENFKMMNEILYEVMGMFPGKYIHIGGDECPKEAWKHSDYCRRLIVESGLRDEEGLQSYIIGRIEKFVNTQGRTIIGWDEILEGGLAPNATVMSWRGEKGGIAAAQLNHDVIMTPGSGGMYFDHAQSKSSQEPLSIGGNAPLEKTYAYDPIPAVLSTKEQKRILGVQANLWTEYISTPAKAEYMLLPRMFALAEVAWSPKANRDFHDFLETRLPKHLAKLDGAGFNYRVPVPVGASDTVVEGPSFSIPLTPTVEGAKIYYTIDGYAPRETDMEYTKPLLLNIPAGKYMEFKSIQITPAGKRSNVTTIRMNNGVK